MDVGTGSPTAIWRHLYFTVHDGTRLYARDYGPRTARALPVVCLAGLTRNSKDFHLLAERLSAKRRVLALDWRGRGRSGRADWRTYTPMVELADTLSLKTMAGIGEAAGGGTSRGGIVAMLMAAIRPTAIRAAVLNDIGPAIAPEGLLRIYGFLNHTPAPADWRHAAEILEKAHGAAFHGLGPDDWMAYARRTFRDVNGRPVIDFDPELRQSYVAYDDIVSGRTPDLWPQFEAMRAIPVLVLRGENSDILTAATVDAMRKRHPRLRAMTVAGRGHPPFLDEPGVPEAIEALLDDAGHQPRPAAE